MAHFAGIVSSDTALLQPLLRAVGPGAQQHIVPHGVVVVDASGGEPVTVAPCPGGDSVTVRRGDPGTAGCAVTLCSDGRPPRFEADSFGQHSVFTAHAPDRTVYFASDPRLLRAFVSGKVDAAALHGYLCFSHVPHPLTAWEGISQILTPSVWDQSADNETVNEARLLALLRASVERRLTTGDVGVYLSGGLDSSLVAALLVEAGVRPRLFTLDFGPPFDGELPLARAVAAHLDLPLTVVPARARHVQRAIGATAQALPQPFGDGVTVPLYLLGEAARNYVPEVWNGEGGDQIFGGWANKPMIAALTHGADTSPVAEVGEYLETYHRFWGMTDRLLTPALRQATSNVNAADWVRPALDRQSYPTLLHRLRAANLRLKGAQNIAPRMTALSDCHNVRVRAPFFDVALARATFALSPSALLAGACEKFLLKQIAEKYLPASVVWQPKRGMGAPTTEWMRGMLGWKMRSRLSPRRLKAQGWFEPGPIRRLLRGEDFAPEGAFRRRRVGEKLWLLFMLQTWCDAHNATEVTL